MAEHTHPEVAVLNTALELPAEQRAAYLDQACAGDAALRQEVEALLRAHEQAGDFLDAGPAGSPLERTVVVEVPPTEKPGDRIGRYKLLQQIGEGGCGVVYMAEQEEPVRRRVALKVIKLGMDTKQVVARFEAERQALALMDHPNIAKVLDAGASETGRPYFVMELVRGVKITDFCDENNLPTQDRLQLFIQVCQAIQHAHQKGVIHRDIKPSNILVTINDGVPVPKVIDFGIAKATAGRLTDQTLFTAFEQFIGTPAYMSPEQAVMTSLDIDTRSDIYSLGVLLYELLTGQTPFEAQALLASGLDAMRRTICEQEPARPSTRLSTMLHGELVTAAKRRHASGPELIHLVRGDLDWIVMKALEKDRTRRYETANGLATDIQRHLSCEAVVARPPSRLYEFQKTVRRHKFGFAAGAALIAVLAVGVLVSSWEAVHAKRAEREQGRLREAAERAQANEAQQRRQAEAQELAARRKAYASDMNLAQQALTANNLGRAQELLSRHRLHPGQVDLRGWEWRYLWQQCQSDSLFTLCTKSNEICSLAVSDDGRWLAVGEHDDGGLSIWDLQARREVARLPAGDGYVFAAFAPRQSLLAFSSSTDYGSKKRRDSVCLWDAAAQRVVSELRLAGECRGVAFADHGQTLITLTHSEVAVWRVPEGTKLAGYPAEADWNDDVPLLAVAPGGRLAAYGTSSGYLCVTDLTTGREQWRARASDEHICGLAFSPDGKILASGAGFVQSDIRLWAAASGMQIARLEGHHGYVQALVFWPDSKALASGSSDQTICLWDLARINQVPAPRTLRGHRRELRRLALLPDGKTLVSGCQDGSVCVWDTTTDRRARTYAATHFSSLNRAWRFAPDSKSILTVNGQGGVVQWQGREFQEGQALLQVGTNVHGARISDDCRLVAAGSADGVVQVWDVRRRTLVHQFRASRGPVEPCQFLAHGRRLLLHYVSSEDIHEWDLASGRDTRSWEVGPSLREAGCSQDGRWFFSILNAGTGKSNHLLDLRADPIGKRNLDVGQASSAALSPDGKLIAAGSHAGFARLWESETLREIATFSDFLQGVNSVAFSPDGTRLATASEAKEAVKLWDVESHEELLTLEGQGASPFSAAFSPDGTVLGTVNSSGVLQLWRAPSWAEIEAAEKTH